MIRNKTFCLSLLYRLCDPLMQPVQVCLILHKEAAYREEFLFSNFDLNIEFPLPFIRVEHLRSIKTVTHFSVLAERKGDVTNDKKLAYVLDMWKKGVQ